MSTENRIPHLGNRPDNVLLEVIELPGFRTGETFAARAHEAKRHVDSGAAVYVSPKDGYNEFGLPLDPAPIELPEPGSFEMWDPFEAGAISRALEALESASGDRT